MQVFHQIWQVAGGDASYREATVALLHTAWWPLRFKKKIKLKLDNFLHQSVVAWAHLEVVAVAVQ